MPGKMEVAGQGLAAAIDTLQIRYVYRARMMPGYPLLFY